MFTRKHAIRFCGAAALVASTASQAAIDVTATTTGIADAATALGLIIAALMTLSVGLFGLVKVYKFVSRKSGA